MRDQLGMDGTDSGAGVLGRGSQLYTRNFSGGNPRLCWEFLPSRIVHTTLSDPITYKLSALLLITATAANWVVRCEATQFAVAATNHSSLSSDETEMR